MTLQTFFTGPETWCQGRYYDERTGACCLTGKLMDTYGVGTAAYHDACCRVREVIGPGVPFHVWNDDPDRTFADIRKVVVEANV